MNSQQHKRITLKDISEQCGYSVNTVSRALRDDPRLPEATISRIKQVADELGYMKNIIASSMRSGHTNLIAVIVDDIQNPHYSDIICDRFQRPSELFCNGNTKRTRISYSRRYIFNQF